MRPRDLMILSVAVTLDPGLHRYEGEYPGFAPSVGRPMVDSALCKCLKEAGNVFSNVVRLLQKLGALARLWRNMRESASNNVLVIQE